MFWWHLNFCSLTYCWKKHSSSVIGFHWMLFPFAERSTYSIWKWWAESFFPALGGAYFIFGPGWWSSCSEAGVLSPHPLCHLPLKTLYGKACKLVHSSNHFCLFYYIYLYLVWMKMGCLVRIPRIHIQFGGCSLHFSWTRPVVLWSTEVEVGGALVLELLKSFNLENTSMLILSHLSL